jgi:GABA(A) receptor-associated protein
MKEADLLRQKHPNHVPVLVKSKDNTVALTKVKYLVAENVTVGQFVAILRKRLVQTVKSSEGLYLFVNNTLPPTSEVMSSIYNLHRDGETGMLILMLCRENTFG